MADNALEFGFKVNEAPIVAGLKRTEAEASKAGRSIATAGDRGSRSFGGMEKVIARSVVAIKSLNVLAQATLGRSELWQQSFEAVSTAIGRSVDQQIEKFRGAVGSAEWFEWNDPKKVEERAKAADRALADPITKARIELKLLRAELDQLGGVMGDRLIQKGTELSKADGVDAEAAAQRGIARTRKELYDQILALEATIEALERGSDVSAATIKSALGNVEAVLDEEMKATEARAELEERIVEAKLGWIKEYHEMLAAAEKAAAELERRQSFAGFKDGFASAVEEMKDLEKVGQSVAQGIGASFQASFFDLFKQGTFNAKKLLTSLLDLALSVISQLAGGQATAGLGALFGLTGKARGGAVTAGTPYIVGEEGPEVFTPSSSGVVTPNGRMAAGGGISMPITIHVQGNVDDPQAMGSSLAAALEQRLLHLLSHNARVREAVRGNVR